MQQQANESKANENARRDYVPKKPDYFNEGRVPIVILSFILGGLIIFGITKVNIRTHNRNYYEVSQLVQTALSQPLYYDEVMSIIKTNMSEKSLSLAHKEELTNIYMSADREKRKHISRLRSILYANFESQGGRMSNFEVSLKYNVLDLKTFQQYFDEFQKLAPNDALYLKYSKLYDQLLKKYNVVL